MPFLTSNDVQKTHLSLIIISEGLFALNNEQKNDQINSLKRERGTINDSANDRTLRRGTNRLILIFD